MFPRAARAVWAVLLGLSPFLSFARAAAPVCALPGRDGTTFSANTYYPGVGTASGSSLTVGDARTDDTPLDPDDNPGTTALSPGDLVFIIQMQDAQINNSNSSSYGGSSSGRGYTSLRESGKYEFARVKTFSSGALTLETALSRTYTSAAANSSDGVRSFQVVRVAQNTSLSLSGTLKPPTWNGSTGGVLVLDALNTLTVNGTIDASEAGFRGGGSRQDGDVRGREDYATPFDSTQTNFGAFKGEGVAGTPRFVRDLTKTGVAYTGTDLGTSGYPIGTVNLGTDVTAGLDRSRGAPGNAGGGGTQHNAGGGGGSNVGQGGQGGKSFAFVNGGAADGGREVGGLGGVAISPDFSRILMGGGAGAGDNNNAADDNATLPQASGGNGGGLIFLRAGTLSGTGTLKANGQDGQLAGRDGAGGGGGGGTVILATASTSVPLNIEVNGGKGGNSGKPLKEGELQGTGGGGGGGAVLKPTGTTLSGTVAFNGGAAGTNEEADPPEYGAKAGDGGIGDSPFSATDVPLAADCLPTLVVDKSTTTPSRTLPADTTATYTVKVSNTSSTATATGVALTDVLPAPFAYSTAAISPTYVGGSSGPASVTGGSSVTTVNFGTAGGDASNSFTLPPNSSVSLTFTVNLNGASVGTYQNPARVDFSDPTTVGATVTPGGSYTSGGTVGGRNYDSASTTLEDVTLVGSTLTAFTCEDRFYLIKRRGLGGSNDFTSLYELDRSGSAISSNLLTDYAFALNAMGFNPVDNFLYAMGVDTITDANGTGYHLYRLGSGTNGGIQDLGLLPSAIPQATASWQAAAFDRNGKYHLYATGTSASTIYTVSGLAGKSSARAAGVTDGTVALSGSLPTQNIGDMAIRPNPANPGSAEDIFLVSSATANTEDKVYQVSASGGATTVIQMQWPSFTPRVGFGAVFYDASGQLYGYDNNGSGFFTLDTASGAVVQLNTGPASVTVDGASCPFIAPRLDVLKKTTGAVPVGSSSTQFDVPFTLEVKNTGTVSAPNVQLSDNLNLTFASASSVTLSTAPSASGCTVNSSFNGTSDFNLLSGSNTLSSGSTCTVTFTARVTYASASAVPTVNQLNQAAASSVTSGSNPGHRFVAGTDRNGNPITLTVPPPLLLNADLSNDKATGVVFPTTPNSDPSVPTPVSFPQLVDLVVKKAALKAATSYSNGPSAPLSDLTVSNAGTSSASYKYVLWIKNNGPKNATNVVVRDTFPVSAQLSLGTLPSGVTVITPATATTLGVLEWNVGNLALNATASVVLPVSLAGDYASSSIRLNTPTIVNAAALFSVTQTDVVSTNNSDSVTVFPNPVRLKKYVRNVTTGEVVDTARVSTSAKPGNTLEYCIEASSTLSVPRDVSVSDVLQANQTFTPNSFTGVANGVINASTVTGTLTEVSSSASKTMCFRTTVN